MKLEPDAIDIFLNPGEVFFGDNTMRIRTVLGSCVAITMWHPQRRIGGMCHFMLPARQRGKFNALDGRYADEAILLLLKEVMRNQSDPYDYAVKLFGGGNMFTRVVMSAAARKLNIADRNVVAGQELLQRYGFKIAAEHLGGVGHRNVIFEISSGDVWVRQSSTT